MNVERPRLRSIADDLLAIDGIAEVYSVAGPYDLIAVVRVKEHEQLSDLVTEQIAALDGIVSTETLIAFRAFSKKDLGLLWDIGSQLRQPDAVEIGRVNAQALRLIAVNPRSARPSRRAQTSRSLKA